MEQEAKGAQEAPVADPYTKYQVTEGDFQSAVERAKYLEKHLTLRRLFRKMTKVTYRAARWVNDKPRGYVAKRDLPPADVEEHVKKFVWHFYAKEAHEKRQEVAQLS